MRMRLLVPAIVAAALSLASGVRLYVQSARPCDLLRDPTYIGVLDANRRHKMTQAGNHGTWTCSGSSVTFNWTQSTDTLGIVDNNTLQRGTNLGDRVKAKRQ